MNDSSGRTHGTYLHVSGQSVIGEQQKEQLQYLFLPIEIFAYVAKQEKAGIIDIYKKDLEREIQKKTMLDNITINKILDSLVLNNFLTIVDIEVKGNTAYGVHPDAEWMRILVDNPKGIEKIVKMYRESNNKK